MGDIEFPSLEAGTTLKFFLHIYYCYDTCPDYDEQGGLGDMIFAPIYELLKRRGVNFKFFHNVEELILNSDNPNIVEQIILTKQVDLVNEAYNPLINVKGLPSWPNEPKYEEIISEQAQLLQEHNIDLENFWTIWPTTFEETFFRSLPEITLKRGKDFDIIVSGIPLASIPYVGSELLEVSSALRDTVKHVERIPSLNVQLYLDVPRGHLGSKILLGTI